MIVNGMKSSFYYSPLVMLLRHLISIMKASEREKSCVEIVCHWYGHVMQRIEGNTSRDENFNLVTTYSYDVDGY